MDALIPPEEAERLHALMLGGLVPAAGDVIHVMAGLPGAGKSTFVAMAQADGRFPRPAFILDPDRVMTALMPYQADLAAYGAQAAFMRWEMPARALAYRLAQEAAAARLPIIKDMGMSRAENWDMLRRFKDAGYRIHLHHIRCSIEMATRAVAVRGRFFPPEQIVQRAESLEKRLVEYADVPDKKFCYERADHDFIRVD
jgi:probable phosphoglycerate mutase